MTHIKIKIVFVLLFLVTIGGYAQQSCYQIGLNEGREIYNEAQRLERSGKCVEAVPRFLDALKRFRLTRSCRDLPANHELDTWEDKCIQGVAACGGKNDETTFLIVSPRSITFTKTGGSQLITVSTNSNSWKVDKYPSWCTIQKRNNGLTVTCKENTGTNNRNDKLLIVANTLTYEVTIEQAGNTLPETPPFASLKITEVKFAGKNADGTSKGYGEELSNNMTFLTPQITCDHLAMESKTAKFDFKILDPNGKLLSRSNSGYTYSDEITLRGNLQKNDVFDVSEWGAVNGTTFATTGKYSFEIWCSGANMFSTTFEVFPKPIIPEESIKIEVDKPEQTPAPPPPTSPTFVSPTSLKTGIGVKVGLNLANINNEMTDIDFSPGMKADFHAGIFYNLNFGYKENTPGFFGLQPEVLYSRQGFALNGNAISFSYITIPVIVKLYLYQGFNFEIGPWVSYLLAVSPNTTTINGNNIKLSDLKGGKDAGIAVGAGYDFNFGLVVGARYQHGLSDMANNLLWTNRVIAISLGWKF